MINEEQVGFYTRYYFIFVVKVGNFLELPNYFF